MTAEQALKLYNKMDNLRRAGVRIRLFHAQKDSPPEVNDANATKLFADAVVAEINQDPLP